MIRQCTVSGFIKGLITKPINTLYRIPKAEEELAYKRGLRAVKNIGTPEYDKAMSQASKILYFLNSTNYSNHQIEEKFRNAVHSAAWKHFTKEEYDSHFKWFGFFISPKKGWLAVANRLHEIAKTKTQSERDEMIKEMQW